MGRFSDEIKRLTLDPGARRMGEIADQLEAEILDIKRRCCPEGPDLRARHPPPPPPPEPPAE